MRMQEDFNKVFLISILKKDWKHTCLNYAIISSVWCVQDMRSVVRQTHWFKRQWSESVGWSWRIVLWRKWRHIRGGLEKPASDNIGNLIVVLQLLWWLTATLDWFAFCILLCLKELQVFVKRSLSWKHINELNIFTFSCNYKLPYLIALIWFDSSNLINVKTHSRIKFEETNS